MVGRSSGIEGPRYGGRGGWIPVVKQRGRQMHPNLRLENRRASLFTLFVDNLPESMASRKLYDLFNMFGVVKDVFIPQKRRKLTYTRFGFVRYDCSITADVAEQKANGLWVDDKSLSVKITEYGKGIEDRQRQKPLPTRHSKHRKASVMAPKLIWHQRTDDRSFAEVIKGVDPRCSPLTTIKVDELENGWLYESMVMRLKADYSIQQVKNELMKREVKNVLVREESGGDAIISFSSKEELLSKMTLLKSWFHDWCEYIIEWRTVTSVMELISTSLNLECDGRVYPIGVFEEKITEEVSISCKGINSSATDKDVCSNINGVLPLPVETNLVNEDVDKAVDVASTSNMALKDLASRMKVRAELTEEGSWSHASTVEETKDCAEILMKKTQVW
ncbi:hypothetical protein ACSBR1_003444 [Camellia fascicularis]